MTLLALDIGGANLKIADGLGFGLSQYFPLWNSPELLPQALSELIARAPSAEQFAITMTGELADCYRTKADGVRSIISAASQAATGRSVLVYQTDGSLVGCEQVLHEPRLAAAANWHALGAYSARLLPGGPGLLMDLGSTTCDIIPLIAGRPAAFGQTDPERLVSGELVYTGVIRSPVAAVVRSLPWRGQDCPVAQELFATTWDAYLVRGDLPEEPEKCHTADGRPATRACAEERLARSICADRSLVAAADLRGMAEVITRAQLLQLERAARRATSRLAQPPTAVVIGGQGEFLARQVVERAFPTAAIISLTEQLGAELSRVATAHALAVLARERLGA
jgi:(4-(4-[2-(gamma-L-glutamylamino)ethyl]phenoxymethyl)furan-2-yl)methanamine synthase